MGSNPTGVRIFFFLVDSFPSRSIPQKVLFGIFLLHFNLSHLNYYVQYTVPNSPERPNLGGLTHSLKSSNCHEEVLEFEYASSRKYVMESGKMTFLKFI